MENLPIFNSNKTKQVFIDLLGMKSEQSLGHECAQLMLRQWAQPNLSHLHLKQWKFYGMHFRITNNHDNVCWCCVCHGAVGLTV